VGLAGTCARYTSQTTDAIAGSAPLYPEQGGISGALAVMSTSDSTKDQVCWYESSGTNVNYDGFGRNNATQREIHFGIQSGNWVCVHQNSRTPASNHVSVLGPAVNGVPTTIAWFSRFDNLSLRTHIAQDGIYKDDFIGGLQTPGKAFTEVRINDAGYATAGVDFRGDLFLFASWDGQATNFRLSVDRLVSLSGDPWQIFERPTARIYSFPGVAGITTTDVPQESVSITPQAPTSLRSLIANIPLSV